MKSKKLWNTRLNRRWLKRLSVKDRKEYTLVPLLEYISKNKLRKVLKDFITVNFPQKTDQEQRKMIIVLMSLPDGDQAIIGCLNFDNNFGNRVAKANDMKSKCTDNVWVPI